MGDLDPAEVSRLLGAEASFSYAKGDPRPSKSATKPYESGMWGVNVPDASPENFDLQITNLFEPLSSDLSIWQGLAERYKLELFAGAFLQEESEGFTLSVEAMRLLVDRGVKFSVDIYTASSDE